MKPDIKSLINMLRTRWDEDMNLACSIINEYKDEFSDDDIIDLCWVSPLYAYRRLKPDVTVIYLTYVKCFTLNTPSIIDMLNKRINKYNK